MTNKDLKYKTDFQILVDQAKRMEELEMIKIRSKNNTDFLIALHEVANKCNDLVAEFSGHIQFANIADFYLSESGACLPVSLGHYLIENNMKYRLILMI